MERSILEVDLSSLIYNLGLVRRLVGKREIIAVVKADAYGLGMEAVSKALWSAGVSFFAVALLKEAISLRRIVKNARILMLSPFLSEELGDIIEHDIIPSVVSLGRARLLNREAIRQARRIPIHVKVDTGMGRLGVRYDDIYSFISELSGLSNLCIEGIYSHFASADIPDREFTEYQIARFRELERVLRDSFSSIVLFHLANSSGIISFASSHFSAVRPGLMLYGCYPSSFMEGEISLKKPVRLRSVVVSLKTLGVGESVSYGRLFVAERQTRVGVLAIGYADGYSTLLSGTGEAIVRGNRVPVIGRVCMDYTMLDLTALDSVCIGDEAILIGSGITEEEIALKTGTIPYEVLTSITSRVKRLYLK